MRNRGWISILSVLAGLVMAACLGSVCAYAATGAADDGGLAKAKHALTVQDGREGSSNAQEMALETSYSVSIDEGDFWVGSFTADAAGIYEFSSSGDVDTCGSLYSDPDLTNELASNDDGPDLNFSIVYNLEANETVYLKVETYSVDSDEFTVSVESVDPYDISGPFWQLIWEDGGVVGYTGGFVELPDCYIYNIETGESLVLNEGFSVVGYKDGDGNTLSHAPMSVGDYSAVIEGKDPYCGVIEGDFSVIDLRNVANMGVVMVHEALPYAAGQTQYPEFVFSDFFGNPLDDVTYTVQYLDPVTGSYVDEIEQQVDESYDGRIALKGRCIF